MANGSPEINLATGSSFTLMAWVWTTYTKDRMPVLTKKDMSGTFGGFDLWINPSDVFVILNDGTLLVSYPFLSSGTILNNGIWHHIAYTFTPN